MGFFAPQDVTGIDVGAGSIKVVRIAGRRRPKLLSVGLVELPLEQSEAISLGSDIKHLLTAKKILGKNVITLIPGKYLTIRSLTLPKMPLQELREAVRWESKRHIPYPLEAAQVECLIVGEKREGSVSKYDVLMVAVERGTVIEHVTPFRDAGVKVNFVDAHPLALRNVLRLNGKTDEVNTLLVDMGAGKTEINIFRGSVLRFSRCLEIGGTVMTRAIADKTGVGLVEAEAAKKKVDALASPEEDGVSAAVKGVLDTIVQEILRSVEYYKTVFREKGVEQTILTGGVSLMSGIKDYVSLSLEGEVEVDEPFALLSCKERVIGGFRPFSPRFSAAVGLALRKL